VHLCTSATVTVHICTVTIALVLKFYIFFSLSLTSLSQLLTLTSLSFYLGPSVHRLVQPLSLMVCFPYVLIFFFIFCEANGYRIYKRSPSLLDRQCCGFGGLLSFSLSIKLVAWFVPWRLAMLWWWVWYGFFAWWVYGGAGLLGL